MGSEPICLKNINRALTTFTYQEPFFSLSGVFLSLLWTFAFRSKGHFTLRFVEFRDYFAVQRLVERVLQLRIT
jgi:hypothetical protein